MERKIRVLIVDDDDELANMYSSHLHLKGFLTERVDNGEKALASVLIFKPDVILLDVMMPKISGFDVLDILKNTDKTANIPIIMLTALSSKEDVEKAKNLGVDVFMEKSTTDLKAISDKINELIGTN